MTTIFIKSGGGIGPTKPGNLNIEKIFKVLTPTEIGGFLRDKSDWRHRPTLLDKNACWFFLRLFEIEKAIEVGKASEIIKY